MKTCVHSAVCSACSLWGLTEDEQKRLKEKSFFALLQESTQIPWPEAIYHTPPPQGFLRHRCEMQIRGATLGFLNQDKTEVFQVKKCEILDPALMSWVLEIQKLLPSIERGSLRARVSPQGLKGIWLDLPNETVQELFQKPDQLMPLLEAADQVEIGQKRKTLYFDAEEKRLRLKKDPVFKPWTRTWTHTSTDKFPPDKEVPLYSTVGDFSQPSDEANRLICKIISDFTKKSRHIFEFGAGNGNLTIPAMARGARLHAVERESRFRGAFLQTLKAAEIDSSQITFESKWMLDQELEEESEFDTLLLNPSREGASRFLARTLPTSVETIIMMSCYPESFAKDSQALANQKFECTSLQLIDQFPYSQHLEVLALFRKRRS